MESVFEHLQVRCAETERQETGSVLSEFALLASSPSAGIVRVTVSCLYLFILPGEGDPSVYWHITWVKTKNFRWRIGRCVFGECTLWWLSREPRSQVLQSPVVPSSTSPTRLHGSTLLPAVILKMENPQYFRKGGISEFSVFYPWSWYYSSELYLFPKCPVFLCFSYWGSETLLCSE